MTDTQTQAVPEWAEAMYEWAERIVADPSSHAKTDWINAVCDRLAHAPKFGHGIVMGMSLRDWFAGHALAGLCTTFDDMVARAHDANDCSHTDAILASYMIASRRAFAIADAMLAERDRETK